MKNSFPQRLKDTLNTHLRSHQGGPSGHLGPLWLALGTLLSLFAANGRWDVPLAAWLAPLFFLRFTRSRSPLIGVGGVWLASMGTMLFFLYESQLLNPLVAVVFLILSTILAVPYLLDRLLTPRLRLVSGGLSILLFPLSRIACEYLTSFSPFGSLFSLAYTQYGNLPLLQIIAVTGIYGVSFLMAWFASVGNWIWEQDFAWPGIRRITLLYSGLLALVLLGGSLRLAFFPPSAQTVRVAGITVAPATRHQALRHFSAKPMTPADLTQVRSDLATMSNELLTRSRAEARAGANIVVWPEVATVTQLEDEATLIARGQTLAREARIYLEMAYGVFQYQAPFIKRLHDRAVLLDPEGKVAWTYEKAHPIPVLEAFAPGDGKVPVVGTASGRIATVICFDADFPDLMRQGGSKGVDVMLVPSNDWQGIDPLHTYDATFPAIENGYSLVWQDSNGLAMTVDYQGHVLAATDYFTTDQQTMIAFVPVKGVWTIYGLVGDLFAWLCILGLLSLVGLVAFFSFQRSAHSSTLASDPSPVSIEERYEGETGRR